MFGCFRECGGRERGGKGEGGEVGGGGILSNMLKILLGFLFTLSS